MLKYQFIFLFILAGLFSSLVSSVTANQDVILEGNRTQGGLLQGKTQPGSIVSFQNQKIKLSENGTFLLGFHRDEPLQSELIITLPDGRKLEKIIKISKREYKIQRIDGLPPSKVSPRKPETLERIKKETALVKKARKRNDDRIDFSEQFIWPVNGPISGVYGSQRVLNGQPRRPHFGVDIARPTGTSVVAPASGIITLSHPDMFFSGGTIMLDHGHGLSSSFLHLSKLHVKLGDTVKQGQLIAEIGATGRVTGAHLDWRMNLFEKRIDPQLLVPAMPINKKMNGKQSTAKLSQSHYK
jgi:murein DD-endopeptidase MepM/ murein hydrolase activator NlpD